MIKRMKITHDGQEIETHVTETASYSYFVETRDGKRAFNIDVVEEAVYEVGVGSVTKMDGAKWEWA